MTRPAGPLAVVAVDAAAAAAVLGVGTRGSCAGGRGAFRGKTAWKNNEFIFLTFKISDKWENAFFFLKKNKLRSPDPPRGRVPPPALLHEVVDVPRAPPRPRQLAEGGGGGGGRLVLPPALVVVHGG